MMIFRRKTKADKEIDGMIKEFNAEVDRRIEEVAPEDEKLNKYIDDLMTRNKKRK